MAKRTKYWTPRITPACAGRTRIISNGFASMRDHPRVCGKNLQTFNRVVGSSGSPPRVREERADLPIPCPLAGITPACAGRTRLRVFADSQCGDHPRVCGKNPFPELISPGLPGSPPRVREEQTTAFSHGCSTGITPACAGRTAKRTATAGMAKDHPRVCGKNRYIRQKESG